MKWIKLAHIYQAPDLHEKLRSHAANPLAVRLHGSCFRIFFSGRDASNRSSVGCFDFDMDRLRIINVRETPVIEHGPADSFYSHGISIGNRYAAGNHRYILFMGWQYPEGGHWRGDVGRLRLTEDCSLILDSAQPFLAASAEDPVSLSYPWVEATSDGYEMWYGSTVSWDAGNGEMLHVIKFASSQDGHQWDRHGLALPYALGVAQAFSRPAVMRDQRGTHMWFSYRSGVPGVTYRIGYAFQSPKTPWQLQLDAAGIDVSPEGWDAEMIAYPFVFEHRGRWYLLYNGNGYGRTGIGLAVLQE